MKERIKKWLGVNSVENRIETLERMVLDEKARLNGFSVLKKHLRGPEYLVTFKGKLLED